MKIKEILLTKMENMLEIASDKTRLRIMLSLLDESACQSCEGECHCGCCESLYCMKEKSVNEIVVETNESQSLISHQLKKLKDNDFVATRKDGRKVFYRLKDGHVKQLLSVVLEHVMEDDSND